jgi:hypothetical protein
MALAGARAIVAAAVLICGCGGPSADFALHDTAIVLESDAPFTRQPDFAARVEDTIESALAYWGGSWRDLRGSTIIFAGSRYVTCGEVTGAIGCYDGDIRISTQDSGLTFTCVEETALVHEVGHAVIGDSGHTDPRWLDFGAVARVLAGRRGYGDGDECPIHVSVWRHPPDREAAR